MSVLLDVLYILSSPFLLGFLLAARRRGRRLWYPWGLLQKLGFAPARRTRSRGFWIHAVSVGEVQAAAALVEALERRFPAWELSVSVATRTGLDVARRRLPGREVFYAPVDLSPSVASAMARRRPAAVILVELELWPNLLLAARRRGIPVFVVNGRITERSSRRYRLAGAAGRFLFAQVTAWGVQNEEYAERLRRLGVPEDRIEVLGNVKHDHGPPPAAAGGEDLRRWLGWPREEGFLVLVAGSTHPGEEAMLCSLLRELESRGEKLRLVLVPRHLERLGPGEIESWDRDRPFRRWSEFGAGVPRPAEEAVLVIDTMGELERFYAAADLVVVGGTFVPHGGHNLIEPARLGKPVLYGPHTENFRDEARHLEEHSAALRTAGYGELRDRLLELLADPRRRSAIGERAREAAARLRGASERHAEWLESWLARLAAR